MKKLLQLIEENAYKIILTAVLTWGLFFGMLFVQSIKQDILNLQEQFLIEQSLQNDRFMLQLNGLQLVIEQLEFLSDQQQYIIDQNKFKINTDVKKEKRDTQKNKKPTYEELKSHAVYIVGCSEKSLADDVKIKYLLGDEGKCWGGTGVIVKMTDTETYILTNNHVSGEGEKNVTLYVQNEDAKVVAEIIKHNDYTDAAVIKVNRKLEGKTPISKIAIANVQDPVYVVGNPLRNKMIYNEGVISGYTDFSLLVQIPCIFGSSGSGIFNADGELVGLVYALQTYPGFLGLPMAQITHAVAVDSISIEIFLRQLGLYNDE